LNSDPLVPKTGLGSRAECFQSFIVVLQSSASCWITSFGMNVSPRMAVPNQGFTPKRDLRIGGTTFQITPNREPGVNSAHNPASECKRDYHASKFRATPLCHFLQSIRHLADTACCAKLLSGNKLRTLGEGFSGGDVWRTGWESNPTMIGFAGRCLATWLPVPRDRSPRNVLLDYSAESDDNDGPETYRKNRCERPSEEKCHGGRSFLIVCLWIY
jgi:hypothetical protein